MRMSIGERIKAMRLAKGMSQASLAKAIGIKPPSLSDIERGESKGGRGSTIIAIARVLDVSPEWLQTGKGLPTRPLTTETLSQSELMAIYKVLTEPNRQALMATARALMSSQDMKPSPVNPFPKSTIKQ